MQREIPVSWHSYGGWFIGHTVGTGHKNIDTGTAQYRASFDERQCIHLARNLIVAKIQNSRTLLRRNWKDEGKARGSDRRAAHRRRDAPSTPASLQELLGIEGSAAARYFGSFGKLLRAALDQ